MLEIKKLISKIKLSLHLYPNKVHPKSHFEFEVMSCDHRQDFRANKFFPYNQNVCLSIFKLLLFQSTGISEKIFSGKVFIQLSVV